jgi:preprotein translocase subunit SecD
LIASISSLYLISSTNLAISENLSSSLACFWSFAKVVVFALFFVIRVFICLKSFNISSELSLIINSFWALNISFSLVSNAPISFSIFNEYFSFSIFHCS